MIIRRTVLAAALALPLAGAARTDGLRPIEARTFALGEVSGVVFHTVERDGLRVVATLAQDGEGTPIRLEAVLAPGQGVVISAPREAGLAPDAVEISRRGDDVLVRAADAR